MISDSTPRLGEVRLDISQIRRVGQTILVTIPRKYGTPVSYTGTSGPPLQLSVIEDGRAIAPRLSGADTVRVDLSQVPDEATSITLSPPAQGASPLYREQAAPESDSAVGFDRAPTRYTSQGRETIDRIRDQCYQRARQDYSEHYLAAWFADILFIAFCEGNALKYRDRAGLKDSTEQDLAKADWYQQMADHVRNPESVRDPRVNRPGFTPYRYPEEG